MIIADTSGLMALFNRREPEHASVSQLVASLDEPLVLSPYVVAELDYLVVTRVGVGAELELLGELASGAYLLAGFDAADLVKAGEVIKRYRDQSMGVTDASLVVLADRYSTNRMLTLDHRHFGVIRPLQGGRFRLMP